MVEDGRPKIMYLPDHVHCQGLENPTWPCSAPQCWKRESHQAGEKMSKLTKIIGNIKSHLRWMKHHALVLYVGWMDWVGWISLGGVRYRAPWGANRVIIRRINLLIIAAHVQSHLPARLSHLVLKFTFKSCRFCVQILDEFWYHTSARRSLNDSALVVSDTNASPTRLVFSNLVQDAL